METTLGEVNGGWDSSRRCRLHSDPKAGRNKPLEGEQHGISERRQSNCKGPEAQVSWHDRLPKVL